MDTCLITVATKDYLQRAIVLYLSSKKYFLNSVFTITLINCDKNNYFEKIKNKNLKINYDNVKFENKDILKNYASNLRVKLLLNNLKYKYIYWFDADTIILKNINNLNNLLEKKDLLIYKHNKISYKKNAKSIFKTGIIGIRNTDIIKIFLEEWNYLTFENGIDKCYWFQDQILITKLIIKYYDILKISYLDKKYIDWDLNLDSFIWVGKGNIKNSDKYLNKENAIINLN